MPNADRIESGVGVSRIQQAGVDVGGDIDILNFRSGATITPDPTNARAIRVDIAGGVGGGVSGPGASVDGDLASFDGTTGALLADSGVSAASVSANLPSAGQKSALAGTSGTPGNANRFVTDGDARNTNTRVPTAHAALHNAGGSDALTIDAVAGVGSLRTLGSAGTSACAGNDSRLTNSRTPTAHATTHDAGGSDPMAIDAVAGTGSLRTLGSSATSACAGNDSRLSNSRTPTAHAATHVTGGGDTIANVVAGGNSGLMAGSDKTKLDGYPTYGDPLQLTNQSSDPVNSSVVFYSRNFAGFPSLWRHDPAFGEVPLLNPKLEGGQSFDFTPQAGYSGGMSGAPAIAGLFDGLGLAAIGTYTYPVPTSSNPAYASIVSDGNVADFADLYTGNQGDFSGNGEFFLSQPGCIQIAWRQGTQNDNTSGFIGLGAVTPGGVTDPINRLHSFAVGFGPNDAAAGGHLWIYHGNGSATTRDDLGATAPRNTTTTYQLTIRWVAGAANSQIGVRLVAIASGGSSTVVLERTYDSTQVNMPGATTALVFEAYLRNTAAGGGAGGGAQTLNIITLRGSKGPRWL